ncbi:hypothetical protein H6F44_11340 [Pseudanabaena sp. FACHB-1277]|uniref:Uncharacterized protein n=1 Tax=Pseudanabaena cinerea FACHB-1277 TaxID=2949581 RepID=A0A926Z6G4_9CYAN|nr:hypothetical protein [Pseudanabaena cinerea]MBD2150708.1 hypothetical protein [Pseudanabaena cinerea FACHB-1277]
MNFGAVIGFAEEIGDRQGKVGFPLAIVLHYAMDIRRVGAVIAAAQYVE